MTHARYQTRKRWLVKTASIGLIVGLLGLAVVSPAYATEDEETTLAVATFTNIPATCDEGEMFVTDQLVNAYVIEPAGGTITGPAIGQMIYGANDWSTFAPADNVDPDGKTQTTKVEPVGPIGYQSTDPNAPCYETPPPCVETAAFTHTYDPIVNGGVITATGEFCGETLYVTSTEWAFTVNSQWPQDLVDTVVLSISEAGEYPYGNPVGCGQGDIYAQWGSPIVPTSTLSGPSVEFTEKFLHQVSDGPTTWIVQNDKCYTVPDEHTYSDGTASWQCTGDETRPATITFTRTHFVSTWDGNDWSEPEFDYAEDITIPTPENLVANCIAPPVLNPGDPTCMTAGTRPDVPANDRYTSSWDRAFDGPGEYTATFNAVLPDNQFVTGDSATVKVTILGKLTGAKDCPTTTTTGLALTGFDNSGTPWLAGGVGLITLLGVALLVVAARQRKLSIDEVVAGYDR